MVLEVATSMSQLHDDPIVIKLTIANYKIRTILVDTGSSVNVHV